MSDAKKVPVSDVAQRMADHTKRLGLKTDDDDNRALFAALKESPAKYEELCRQLEERDSKPPYAPLLAPQKQK